jgi:hypothetical protein
MDGLAIGRIVRFLVSDDRHGHRVVWPAIVVGLIDQSAGVVNLQVFMDSDSGCRYAARVPYDGSTLQAGQWHWPGDVGDRPL